jgi:hypothetical protein
MISSHPVSRFRTLAGIARCSAGDRLEAYSTLRPGGSIGVRRPSGANQKTEFFLKSRNLSPGIHLYQVANGKSAERGRPGKTTKLIRYHELIEYHNSGIHFSLSSNPKQNESDRCREYASDLRRNCDRASALETNFNRSFTADASGRDEPAPGY